MRLAEEAIRSLEKQQQQGPDSSLLHPQEAVMPVVPKVLQGFWLHPLNLSSILASVQLSPLVVEVTTTVLDQLSSSLPSMEQQVTFSRYIRDDLSRGRSGRRPCLMHWWRSSTGLGQSCWEALLSQGWGNICVV